jgi:integrase
MPGEYRAAQRPNPELAEVIAEYLERYTSHNARTSMKARLHSMLRTTQCADPQQMTTRALLAWIRLPGANNTVRGRLSTARAFFTWCKATGLTDHNPCDNLPNITKQYPTTYGKVQHKNPARFLTRDEAFGRLIPACLDGTPAGLRDEIAIRLGLSGMRVHEISTLTVGHVSNLPHINWTGKGNKARSIVAGEALCVAVRAWLTLRTERYAAPALTDPLLLPQMGGKPRRDGSRDMLWDNTDPVAKDLVSTLLTKRAELAGLGHVAPHDLRRTAASILHHATTGDGAHEFDLLDIQRVLGHSDPATTMRSYLEPMDTDVTQRASKILD